MKKSIVYLLIGIVIIITIFSLINRNSQDYQLYEVKSDNITKEILETGAVTKGEALNLSFPFAGTIEKINVSEGQLIEEGQVLIELDKTDLLAQRNQAQQKLASALAELELLKKGGRDEAVKTAENKIENTLASLQSAERALEQAEETAQNALDQAYSPVFSSINESYILTKSIIDGLEEIRDEYFVGIYFSETYQARNSIMEIKSNYQILKDLVNDFEKNDESLLTAEKAYANIEKEIENIILVIESDKYKDRISQADEEIIWDYKDEANSMLLQLTSLKNNIASVKNQNNANIIAAESQKITAQTNYTAAVDNLENVKLGGTSLEVESVEALVESAREDVNLIQRQIERSTLTAPSQSRVSLIHTQEKERIAAFSPVIVLIPEKDFQIKADVYERDVVKIQTGNSVVIEFIAFPKQEFKGEIISINPIGKIKDNVVYYEIIVDLKTMPDNLMVEMTADLIIQVEQKQDVLVFPQQAVIREAGKTFVRVFENRQIIKREIETGISDFAGNIEALKGLEPGEIIILD